MTHYIQLYTGQDIIAGTLYNAQQDLQKYALQDWCLTWGCFGLDRVMIKLGLLFWFTGPSSTLTEFQGKGCQGWLKKKFMEFPIELAGWVLDDPVFH